MTAEDRDAIAFVAEFRRQWPQHATQLVHLANEYGTGARDGAYFAKLKKRAKMGVTKGTADYFLAVPMRNAGEWKCGLWLELKAEGGTVKPEQTAFLETMTGSYGTVVAWGWVAALHCASLYLSGKQAEGVLGCPAGGEPVALDQLTKTGTKPKRKEKLC